MLIDNRSLGFSIPEKTVQFPLERLNCLTPNYKSYIIKDSFYNCEYEIKHKRRYLKSRRICNYILAFDTETYKGKCKLLADNNSRYILRDNYYSDYDFFKECLNFLFYKYSKSSGYRFFYNIDFDISAILKLYPKISLIDKLSKGIQVKICGFSLYWLKGKFFKMTKNGKSVFFTDLFNFFKLGLEVEAQTYLKDIKKDKIDGNLLNTDIDYWNNNLENIIKYCIKDCKITHDLAKMLIDNIMESEIALPKLLVSAGSLAKTDFRTNCWMTNLKGIPKEIVQIGYDCYFGGKFEIQKKGYFNELFLYDKVSQYPDFIKELYDLNYGIWKESYEIPSKETFGYFKVDLNIPPELEISTIPIKLKNNLIYTVCGVVKNKWFTWYDLDLMRDFITKIYRGYIFYPTIKEIDSAKEKLKYVKPFKERILFHFEKKHFFEHIQPNEMKCKLSKLVMNAVYGSFIERHKNLTNDGNYEYNVGVLFNPIYASQITAYGRWSVIKDIPKNQWNFICAIHTDSLISQIPLDKHLDIGTNLGQWKLEKKGNGLILNTGIYQIDNLVKTRGIPKKEIKDLIEFCKNHSDLSEYEFKFNRMKKIRSGIIQDKSLDKVNTFQIIKRSLSCNSDVKRDWNSVFFNFADCLNRIINSKLFYVYMKSCENEISFDNIYQNPLNT